MEVDSCEGWKPGLLCKEYMLRSKSCVYPICLCRECQVVLHGYDEAIKAKKALSLINLVVLWLLLVKWRNVLKEEWFILLYAMGESALLWSNLLYLSLFTTDPSNVSRIVEPFGSLKFTNLNCFNWLRLGIRLSVVTNNSLASSLVFTGGLGWIPRALISFIFLKTRFSVDIFTFLLMLLVKSWKNTYCD